MPFIPHTDDDIRAMLASIGVASIDELFDEIPAALRGNITIDRGRVAESNFHQYEPLRMHEMPVVDVHIVPSTAAPGGMGELTTPPIAAAVGNAIYAATGKRILLLLGSGFLS